MLVRKMSEKIKSGLEQANSEKFKKLVNEIKKKMNLKFFRDEYTEVYESEILINGWIYININQKNAIYLQDVKYFRMVHDMNVNVFFINFIYDDGFSAVSMSIIKKIIISNNHCFNSYRVGDEK